MHQEEFQKFCPKTDALPFQVFSYFKLWDFYSNSTCYRSLTFSHKKQKKKQNLSSQRVRQKCRKYRHELENNLKNGCDLQKNRKQAWLKSFYRRDSKTCRYRKINWSNRALRNFTIFLYSSFLEIFQSDLRLSSSCLMHYKESITILEYSSHISS